MSLFLLVTCALFFTAESYAQCTFKLVDRNNTLDTFTKFSCSRASKSCNRKLNRLRYRYPGSYRHAYCIADNNSFSDRTVVRSYDRCRTFGAVGCTGNYSDGSCYGCRGYDNPSPYVNYYSGRTLVQSYDRCQAPGIVRCTAHYSDGTTTTEDYSCYGCRGYGNPAGDPCGWMCTFPQVN